MYIQLIGRMLALPWVAALTMPPPWPPKALGRNGARCDFTAQGPTPGPPPPCGMQKVLCRLRCATSEPQIGRASCRERVCQYVSISVVAVSLKKKQTTKH